MNWKIGVVLVVVVSMTACEGCADDPDTPSTNNGTSNNGTSNNGTSNNGTSNNGTSNNGTSNNGEAGTCPDEFRYDEWRVTEDRRLTRACSPYIVAESIEVTDGAVLTIDPGVELRVGPGQWLRIDGGKLVADGTAELPIVFTATSSSPSPGTWLGVHITAAAVDGSSIRNATIEYGGEVGSGTEACLTIEPPVRRASIALENVTFSRCEQGGLSAPSPVFSRVSALAFEEIDGFGMSLGAETVGQVAEAFSFEGVTYNRISTEPVTKSATWVAQPVPYRVATSIDVAGELDPVLTLEAGVRLQFGLSQWFRVGANGDGGVVTLGTVASPVVFESVAASKAAGDWLGIFLDLGVLGGTDIAGAVVRHGGQDASGAHGCLTVSATTQGRVTIRDSKFEKCLQAGISAVDGAFAFAAVTNNEFSELPIGLDLAPNGLSTVGPQTYDSVPRNAIRGATLTRSATWVSQGIPWDVRESIDVNDTITVPTLTLEAGIELRFLTNQWLRVGANGSGGLIARGSAAAPVVFGSSQASPAPGSWLGLNFNSGTAHGSDLNYIVVRFAGQAAFGQRGALTMINTGTALSVRNSRFSENLQTDIFVDAQSTPLLADNVAAVESE